MMSRASNRLCIVRIDREQAAHLARLRGIAGLQVAEAADAVWLRAPADDETIDQALRSLPGERFLLADDGQLVPHGKRVPTGRLPTLEWQPLARWAAIMLPVAALPARLVERAPLRLVRGGQAQPAAAIVTTFDRWLAYANSAAEARLKPLVFAQSEEGRVLIWGTPLPPLAGELYTVESGVAVPCGWSVSPPVDSDTLRRVLGLAEGDLALFNCDGSFERIAADSFVKASRAAARASAPEAAHG